MKSPFLFWMLLPFSVVAQNVGIGTPTPTGPLSFASSVGNKIVLWGDGNTSHYGIGLQGGLLQIYANLSGDAVGIGFGRSVQFTERLRVQGNGNIGIGTSAPAVRLDVAGTDGWNLVDGEGDMRIGNANARLKFGVALGGGGAGTAGIMQAGGVGLLNIGAAGKYLLQLYGASNFINMQGISGGLRINGNAGNAGQVLTSGGASALPYWANPPGANVFNYQPQTGNTPILNSGAQPQDWPGLIMFLNISVPSRVVVQVKGRIHNQGCFACSDRRTFVLFGRVQNDGNLTTQNATPVYTPNSEMADFATGPIVIDLDPGNYTYKVRIEGSVYGTASVFGQNGSLSWQIFPR
jgi:hypothetical protein